jgi:hypothetical protein
MLSLAAHDLGEGIVKKMSFTLSLLATAAMVIEPVTPSIAQSVGSTIPVPRAKPPITKPIARPVSLTAATTGAPTGAQFSRDMAADSRSFIITREQWDSLATSSPALHSKLLKAHQTGGSLNLTAEEKATLKVLTYSNLSSFRAGNGGLGSLAVSIFEALGGWGTVAVVVIGGVVYLIATSKPHQNTQQLFDVKEDPNNPSNINAKQKKTLNDINQQTGDAPLGMSTNAAQSSQLTTTTTGF